VLKEGSRFLRSECTRLGCLLLSWRLDQRGDVATQCAIADRNVQGAPKSIADVLHCRWRETLLGLALHELAHVLRRQLVQAL
jgi:hypothetical protein